MPGNMQAPYPHGACFLITLSPRVLRPPAVHEHCNPLGQSLAEPLAGCTLLLLPGFAGDNGAVMERVMLSDIVGQTEHEKAVIHQYNEE